MMQSSGCDSLVDPFFQISHAVETASRKSRTAGRGPSASFGARRS